MKLHIFLVVFIWFALAITANATKHYRFYGAYLALHRVSYDTYVDKRDNRSYKVYRIEKIFSSTKCDDAEYCLDTAIVYMFAENAQYATPHSTCHSSGCDKYGRYYSKEDIDLACPAGWHIPASNDMNVMSRVILGGDTIYGTSDRYLRNVHTTRFPADGTVITDRYMKLDDFPSGWFDAVLKNIVHSEKIGTIWVHDETGPYPAYIDFGLVGFTEMNSMVQESKMESTGNMYPIKCHKVVFKTTNAAQHIVPGTFDPGIYSMDELR